MSLWLSIGVITAVGGLGVALVVWLVRGELHERRRERVSKRMLATYRPALPAGRKRPEPEESTEPMEQMAQQVTVAELVARVEAEGLAVRLGWEKGERPDREWPTG